MNVRIVKSVLMGLAGSVAMADTGVPSGQIATLSETLIDGDTVRFRFLTPAIAPVADGLNYTDVEGDFMALCHDVALPVLADLQMQPSSVVISMMSAPTEFGVANPEVIQFFEGFIIENNACIWEQF